MRNAILAALFGAGTVLVALGGESSTLSAYGPAADNNPSRCKIEPVWPGPRTAS